MTRTADMAAKILHVVAMTMLMGIHNVAAKDHIVGDDAGWTVPGSSDMYSSWAAEQKFRVGDTLVFNFPTGFHTVAKVGKAAFEGCDTSNVTKVFTDSPVRVPIKSKGTLRYICTMDGHCASGQKLAITVTGTIEAAPGPQALAMSSAMSLSSLISIAVSSALVALVSLAAGL